MWIEVTKFVLFADLTVFAGVTAATLVWLIVLSATRTWMHLFVADRMSMDLNPGMSYDWARWWRQNDIQGWIPR